MDSKIAIISSGLARGGALLAAAATVAALVAARSADLAPAPTSARAGRNVLLISIDTLRADHLGSYGYARPTSPRLDAFAAESFLFENAIAHAPSTEPSHASIFTSLLPVRHGALRAHRQGISPDVTTMAELFRGAGYRTVSFNGGGQVAAAFGFDRGFELYQSSTGDFAAQVDSAIRWLREHDEASFFMFLHTYEVHAPYAAAPRYLDLFDAGYDGPLPDETSPRLILEIANGDVAVDAADLRHIIATYDAQIRSVDDAFGRLVDFLAASGRDQDTLVLFTSDHGEELGEHGRIGDHSFGLHDEVLRVPLILRPPGARAGGARIAAQVRGIDILPTLLELVGQPLPKQLEGASLVPLMSGRADRDDRIAVSQVDTLDRVPPASLRTGDDKLIVGSADFVDAAEYRWFADRAELWVEGSLVQIPIEAHLRTRSLRVLLEGQVAFERPIETKLQFVSVRPRRPGRQRITLEATTPCTPTAQPGTGPDLPCASFRVFNPHAYYSLRGDPAEAVNLIGRPEVRERVKALRDRLRDLTASPSPSPGAPARLDRETLEQLRALGYLR